MYESPSQDNAGNQEPFNFFDFDERDEKDEADALIEEGANDCE